MSNSHQQQGQAEVPDEMVATEMNEQMQIRLGKLEALQEANNDPFEEVVYDVSHHAAEIVDQFEELEDQVVSVAGRIMSKRGMGKVSFCDLYDRSGKIQIFTKIDMLGESDYAAWQNLDIGDIVGVTGEVMKSKRGEISLRNKKYVLLAKALRPLPEKFHGLKDVDMRYRQRYVDLIVNQDVKKVFEQRSLIIKTIRSYLDELDFLEVETPILNVIAGGATARPFITHHNALNIDLYLRIAPELYLKRLIVGGLERVYELGRTFRNEGLSIKHNPEFTMMEVYQAYTDYKGMMELTEQIISRCAKALYDDYHVVWNKVELDLTPPFRRMTMIDAVKEYANIDFNEVPDTEAARKLAEKHDLELRPEWKKGDYLNAFFEAYVEDHLVQPTFIYDYPVEISPLTKRKPGQPELTERFELFICGNEFANAYSELNDPVDQRRRFSDQLIRREAGDEEANLMDEDYCRALEYGLPPTGGMGIGIDRLCMMLTDSASIRDVLLFPTMKPEDGSNVATRVSSKENLPGSHNLATTVADIDFSKVKVEPLFEEEIDFETFSKSDVRVVKVLHCEEIPKSKKLLKFILDDGSGEERTILSGIKDYYSAEELIGKTLLAICNLPPRKMMGIDSEGMILSAIHDEEEEEKLNLIMLDDRIPAGAKIY
ncbi:MAG TPA: lysine--tRNA ligase [Clostridiaceae bacterium]|nr:lysine--tRNA ligase [Clostridiaceae bacterium]